MSTLRLGVMHAVFVVIAAALVGAFTKPGGWIHRIAWTVAAIIAAVTAFQSWGR